MRLRLPVANRHVPSQYIEGVIADGQFVGLGEDHVEKQVLNLTSATMDGPQSMQ